jgi:hypothetical protein
MPLTPRAHFLFKRKNILIEIKNDFKHKLYVSMKKTSVVKVADLLSLPQNLMGLP